MDDLLIGIQLANHRVLRQIGQGGMGLVYLARHETLQLDRAVKVLYPEASQKADLVARFLQEALAMANLHDPAFVQIFDYGTLPDGRAYLLMEYLVGENLGEYLRRVSRMSWSQAAAVIREIARALSIAHSQGIIHRDLKPDNVFLVPGATPPGTTPADGTVKILDFGIAKLKGGDALAGSSRTSTGLLLGTPLFMSPEQCRGTGSIDSRCDIYALGCVLHTMITGMPPFPLEGTGEIIAAHLSEAPRGLGVPGVRAPQDLDRLVLWMLAKRPEDRPANMEEVVASLDRLQHAQDASMIDGLRPLEAGPRVATMIQTPVVVGGTLVLDRPEGTLAPDPDSVDTEGAQRLEPKEDAVPNSRAGTLTGAVVETTIPPPRRERKFRAVVSRLTGFVIPLVLVFPGLYFGVWTNPSVRRAWRERTDSLHASPGTDISGLPTMPAAAATPPASDAIASILVRSDPRGAAVLDASTRVLLGRTPLRVPILMGRIDARILLEQEGYSSREVVLTIRDQNGIRVKMNRKHQPATR